MTVIEMLMIHTTLNNGRTTVEDPSTVKSTALDAFRPIIKAGGGTVPGNHEFTVRIKQTPGGATFSIFHGSDAIVICGLAWTKAGAAASWAKLVKAYSDAADNDVLSYERAIVKPDQTPWMAAIILPAVILHLDHDMTWLDPFERLLAFAIMAEAK